MAVKPSAPRHQIMLPPVRCPAGSAPRAPHEWSPLGVGGYFCTSCLSRLMPSDVEDWRLLLQIEGDRGEAALSGDAYAALTDLVANAVMLSPAERRVWQRLGAEPKYVVRHEDLAEAVWGQAVADSHDRAALRQHITTLRRKLAQLRIGVDAVPSIGYRLMMNCSSCEK